MSEVEKIVLTAAVTLLGGTTLLVTGEFLKALVIVPLQKYKEQVQLTLDRLDYYANRLTNHFNANPNKEEQELIATIKADLRSAATQLSSKYVSISWRKLLIFLKVIPTGKNIEKAYSGLMFLHNSILYKDQVDEHNNTRINAQKITEVKAALTDFGSSSE